MGREEFIHHSLIINQIIMRKITWYLMSLLFAFIFQVSTAQENQNEAVTKIEMLENAKKKITLQEKEELKREVENINARLEKGVISKEEATILKEEAAKKRALNIENRISILDSKIELVRRNGPEILEIDTLNYMSQLEIGFGGRDGDGERIFGIRIKENPNRRRVLYDRRTYSDFYLAIGLNNAIIDGQSLEETPYKVGGSRFFEFGWQWRTRVFQNSNFLRFNYGVSFQFNGLKPKDNQYFVPDRIGQVQLEEFEFDLDKSKLRMDNLVFPLHLEFGPSKLKKTENTIRYSLRNQFRIGIGGYGGFNLGTRQKLKYERNGKNVNDELKRGYNTSDFIYGLSAYAGFDGVLLYVKYDLNPIFQDAVVEQRNISLGLRFDL
jgi:hypothetical protein